MPKRVCKEGKMKQLSIKTTDGIRYDLPPGKEYQTVYKNGNVPYAMFEANGAVRYININHIVCFTVKEVDDG